MPPENPLQHPAAPRRDRGASHRRRSAFTLIELLTVIAIIGVLAAILIPVVGKIRESARAAQCVSNLRSIGQAVFTYAGDNRDTLPGPCYSLAGRYANFSKTPTTLGGFIGPYLNEIAQDKRYMDVLTCPSWASIQPNEPTWDGLLYQLAAGVSSVGNGLSGENPLRVVFGINPETPVSLEMPKTLTQVLSTAPPTRTWMLHETDLKAASAQNASAGNRAKMLAEPFHKTFRNAVYFDGSVRPMPVTE